MGGLICRSCRAAVSLGDLICGTCQANLVSGGAVPEEPTAGVAVDADAFGPLAPPADVRPAGVAPPPAEMTCPHCATRLPTAGSMVCPGCLRPLGGGLNLRLADDIAAGSRWQRVMPAGSTLVLGRDPEVSRVASLLARPDTVSRNHARITVDADGRGTVTDLGSTNGTYVDDEQVDAGVEAPLRHGSRLRLGRSVTLLVEHP